jgi:hypothetical protein
MEDCFCLRVSNVYFLTRQGILIHFWSTFFSTKVGDNGGGDKKEPQQPPAKDEKKGMSGIGIFFTIILVLAAVYFIGGAFYNFKMYNARGRDLIPHIGKFFTFYDV